MAEESDVLQQAQDAAKARDYERALQLFDQAVDAEASAEALAGRASVHNKLKNFMEAAADASRALEMDDTLAAAHKEKGNACYNLEEFESAMDAFEAAAALEPTKSIHKTWVNMCKVQLGEQLPPTPINIHPGPVGEAPPEERASTSGSGQPGAGGGAGTITLQGDQLQAFLAQSQQGKLAAALGGGGGAGGAPREAPEEPGSERPTHVTVDDPEFSKYWKAPIAASVAASLPDKPQGVKYRHQWFQSPQRVEVDVLAKGLKKEQVGVTIEPRRLRVVTISAEGQEEYDLDLALHGEVVPEESRFEVLGSKVEIKLRKAAAEQWPQLEAKQQGTAPSGSVDAAPEAAAAAAPEVPAAVPAAAAAAPAGPAPPPPQPTPAYPYAGKKVDWDRFAKELQQEEKEEKLEGDAALMKFFRELYDGGDEDTRRAMVKSMQESRGTALSMNWGEVGKQDYSKKTGESGDAD